MKTSSQENGASDAGFASSKDRELNLPNIDELRALRNEARDLASRAALDLAAYIHKKDEQSFVRLPTSEHLENDVGVTVTASCLMGLAQTESFEDEVLRDTSKSWSPAASFEEVLSTEKWSSSGLIKMNAFTSTLVLRTFGFLVERGIYTSEQAESLVHRGTKETRDKDGKPVQDGTKAE